MATKIIKAWIDGVVQNVEVEDIVSPEQPLSIEERVDTLEDKHEVIFTDGNLLVGNGTNELEEMTPEKLLEHIDGATIIPLTTAEYEALSEDDINANALYSITDGDSGAVQYNEAQELTDEQKLQARENIGVEYTESDALELLAETDTIVPVSSSDNSVLIDENGNVITI